MDNDLARDALRRRLLELGYAASSVSEYVNGQSTPSLARLAEIEAKVGIPASAWAAGVPLTAMWQQLQTRSE